jgi:hypothetical protein
VGYVRFAPKADKWADISVCPLSANRRHMQCNKQHALFDHLVGGYEQAGRDGQAERLCRFEVDDQLGLDRGPGREARSAFRPLGYDRHRWPRAENCHCCRFRTIVIRRVINVSGITTRPPLGSRACAAIPHLSFVHRIALPDNVSHCLHPLQQRCRRARIQEQFVADTADGLMVLLIQSDQHEELGISQSRLIKQRFQESVQRQIRRIHCEAKVIFEFWKLFRCHSAHFRSNGGSLARLLMSQIVDARFNRKPLG